MSEADLEAVLADFDQRARDAQTRVDAQRRNVRRYREMLDAWILAQLEDIAARLDKSGHEAEVRSGGDLGVGRGDLDPGQFVQLRLVPRALPGQRLVRPTDRQPLVRFQLDAPEGVVQVWARDVSLDGRDVRVGFRNDETGQPLSVALEHMDPAFVWTHVLETVRFAMRESAQEELF